MWQLIIWNSASSGGAQCHGVLNGRVHHRTVLTISDQAGNLGRWFPPWTVTREMWRVALNATVSGVSTDALLFSRSGMLLVHRYHVFGGGGAHVSVRGSFMSHLRTFTVQADIWLVNWTRNGRPRCGRILICSVICVAGRHRMSPHIVNIAGLCLHIPGQFPPPLLPRLFRHRFLVCDCARGVPLCRRSIFTYQILPIRILFRPDFSLCGSNAGVSSFSRLSSFPISVPQSGCYFV